MMKQPSEESSGSTLTEGTGDVEVDEGDEEDDEEE